MLARTSIYDHPVSSSIGRLSFISAEGVSSAGAAASCALRFFPMVATPAAPRLLRGALQRCARCGSTHALACLFKFSACNLALPSSYKCEALTGADGGIKSLSKEVLQNCERASIARWAKLRVPTVALFCPLCRLNAVAEELGRSLLSI